MANVLRVCVQRRLETRGSDALRCAALPVPVSTAAHCLTGEGRGCGLRALGWHNARAKHVNIFGQRHG